MKLYVAGPMTSFENFNRAAFDDAEEVLTLLGHDVHTPVRGDIAYYGSWEEAIKHPWEEHLTRDVGYLLTGGFEGIVLLPGWKASRGARLEYATATDVMELTAFDYSPSSVWGISERFPLYEENPERQRQTSGGVKDNKSKSRVDLIPSKPLIGAGMVLGYGARKYKPNNWRLGLAWSDTIASAMRHLLAFTDGEDIDPENDLPHIDEALCQVLFQSEYYHTKTGIDDRWSSLSSADKEAAKA